MPRPRIARAFAAAGLATAFALGPAAAALAIADATGSTAPTGSQGNAVPAASALIEVADADADAADAADAADTDDFEFSSFDAIYELSRDEGGHSLLDTTETLVAVFPEFDQNRGIRRAIPRDYDGHPTDIDIESVTDAAGTPRPFETEVDETGEFLLVTIRADDFVHGEQSYVIDYRQHNVTHVPDDVAIDEFYWDVNGTGWAQPFGSVRAELRLSADIAEAFMGDAACYRGWSGSRTPCESLVILESPTVVSAEAVAIGPYENLTIAAGFEAGTFEPRDESFVSSPAAIGSAVAAALAVIVANAAIFTRAARWRDHPGRGIVVAQYEPPAGVSAMVAADLVGQPGKGVTATILQRAVDGELRIVETGRRSYAVEYAGGAADAGDSDSQSVVAALFDGNLVPGAQRSLKSRDISLGKRLLALRQSVTKRATTSGLRRRPAAGPRVLFAVLGIAAAVGSVVLGIMALDARMGGGWPVVCFIAAIVAALVTLIVVVDVRPLTEPGRAARDHLEGLRLYIRLAEADRLRVLQSPSGALRVEGRGLAASAAQPAPDASTAQPHTLPDPALVLKLNERLLPYAVLFGLEREWSRELAALYEANAAAPGWYAGRDGFNVGAFAAGVSSFSSASATSWSGASSSSSSSGSSGGGSSGGGGGGGGGGGV